MTWIPSIIDKILEPIIPWVTKKYLDQPKLFANIRRVGGGRKIPLGFSNRNTVVDGVMEITPESIQVSQVVVPYSLTLRNNSEHPAYKIKLLKPMAIECEIEPSFDYLKPIVANASDSYTLTFTVNFEGTGEEAHDLFKDGLPYFHENKVVLEYENVRGTKFYTEFDLNREEDHRNIFHRKNPLSL